MNYTLALDSETGSLNPKDGDILTLYIAVLDDQFKIVEELDLKLKPDGRLPIAEAGALRVNKIDLRAHIEDPATVAYSQAKEKIVTMIKKYLKKNGRFSNIRPLGQNVTFDLDFINEHVIPKNEWDSLIHYAKIDTKAIADFMKDCQWLPKEVGNLGSLVDFFKIPKRTAHSAKDDTLMTIGVYIAMVDLMKAKKENGQTQDLISLLESE